MIRPAVQFFYSPLGLRPEQVGISQASMVARAAAWGGLSLVIALGGLLSTRQAFKVGQATGQLLVRHSGESEWIQRVGRFAKNHFAIFLLVLLAVVIAVAVPGVWLLIEITPDRPPSSALGAILYYTVGFCLLAFIAGLGSQQPGFGPAWMRGILLQRALILFALGIGLVVSGAVAATTWHAADRFGNALIAGDSQAAVGNTFNNWFGLVNGAASVYDLTGKDPLGVCDSSAVIPLGEDGGGTWGRTRQRWGARRGREITLTTFTLWSWRHGRNTRVAAVQRTSFDCSRPLTTQVHKA